jgi:YesN/AraC family two-component response regulator
LRSALLVCLSGHGDDRYRRRARDAGFDHFLLKPADPEHLRQLLSAFHAMLIAAAPDGNST